MEAVNYAYFKLVEKDPIIVTKNKNNLIAVTGDKSS